MADGPRPCDVADHGSPRAHRIHCHVTLPADGPLEPPRCVSCAQSLDATYPSRAHSSTRALHLPSTPLLSLSLPPTLPKHPLSLAKPWRSFPSSTLAIEALPHRSIARECQGTTPTSYTAPISSSSLGRIFPNEFFFYSISSFKPQARKTTPSYSKPSPSP